MERWLSGRPCEDRISRECGLKIRDVTWDGVVSEFIRADVVVFQKLTRTSVSAGMSVKRVPSLYCSIRRSSTGCKKR